MSINNPGVEANDQRAPIDQEDVDFNDVDSGSQGQEKTTADFYKSELEKVKAERDNYKQGMLSAKQREKERLNQYDEGDSAGENLSESKILSVIEEKFNTLQQETVKATMASALATLSSNNDERELIVYYYNNKIQRSGTTPDAIFADLETAKFLANRRRNERDTEASNRIASNKISSSGASMGSNQDRQQPNNLDLSKFSERDRALLTRAAQSKGLSLQEYAKKHAATLFPNN